LPTIVKIGKYFKILDFSWFVLCSWYYHEDKPIVLWLTLIMYTLGLGYYVVFARRRLVSAAPEELAARAGHEVK
jgi:hypothetical protein